MNYLGSKRRIVKPLLRHVLRYAEQATAYVEPFVGGANVIEHVPHTMARWGNDANPYLIALLEAVRDGWDPPVYVSEALYNHIKTHRAAYHPALVGFVGFGCSFGRKFWDGYARDSNDRNYAMECRSGIIKERAYLQGVRFTAMDYVRMDIPSGSVVYCDPPYADVTGYASGAFDNAAFWEWARNLSRRALVYVSEYTAPADFMCIAEFAIKSGATCNRTTKIERLFVHSEGLLRNVRPFARGRNPRLFEMEEL